MNNYLKSLGSKYLLLLTEKIIKIGVNFFIIYFLKSNEHYSILALYALIEIYTITISGVSLFGTDIISQREMSSKKKLLNIFMSFRFFNSILLFVISTLTLNFFLDENFTLVERFFFSLFLLISFFNVFEFYLYSQNRFKEVYQYKIAVYIFSFFLKLFFLTTKPKMIIFTPCIDLILLSLMYLYFMKIKFKVQFAVSFKAYIFFYKKYFTSVLLLFISGVVISYTNQSYFSILKNRDLIELVANFYLFVKVAEGLNFVSYNLGLMYLPKVKNLTFFLLDFIKKKKILIVSSLIGLFFLTTIVFYVYNIKSYILVALLATILFIINTYHILLGMNLVFNKKEKYKLVFNFLTFTLIIVSVYFYNSTNFIYYIVLFVFSKFISAIFINLILQRSE